MEKMRMMLVDDEVRFLSTTKKLLAKKGYDVVTASSGAEALEKIRSQNIHVVILDVKMPGMDGIETLEKIKKSFPLTEIVMLTGHGTIESAIEGMKKGAYDYLLKPCDIDQLMLKVQEATQKKRNHEEKIREAKVREAMSMHGLE